MHGWYEVWCITVHLHLYKNAGEKNNPAPKGGVYADAQHEPSRDYPFYW